MNIYLEDDENGDAIEIATSAPSGFTISDAPTIDWDKYAERLLQVGTTTAKIIRDGIAADLISVTWASGTDEQKDIWSNWHVASKSQRDEQHTADEQKDSFKALVHRLILNKDDEFAQAKADELSTFEPAVTDGKIEEMDGGIVKTMIWLEEDIGITTAGKSVLSSTNQFFVSFAGVGSDDEAGLSIIVPEDYHSMGCFGYWWIMDGSGTDTGRLALLLTQQSDLEGDYTDVDETLEILDDGQDVAAWKSQFTGYNSVSSLLVPGKKLHIQLVRDPADAQDTMSDTIYLEVLVFKYISKR